MSDYDLTEKLLAIRKEQLERELKAISFEVYGARLEERNLATVTRLMDAKAIYNLTWEELSAIVLYSSPMLQKVVARKKNFSEEAMTRINDRLAMLFMLPVNSEQVKKLKDI